MWTARRIGPCAGARCSVPDLRSRRAWACIAARSLTVAVLIAASALAQQPAPIADRVETPLLPSGISESPVALDSELVYVFKEPDGVDALHFAGGFALTVGGPEPQTLRAHEAVVWLENREHEKRPYRHLQVMLWRDAEVDEIGGTLTTGPALFVTLSTFGEVTVRADDVAMQPPGESDAYRSGRAIREAFLQRAIKPEDAQVALGMFDPTGLSRKPDLPAPKPIIHFESRGEVSVTRSEDGRQVVTMTGGVYLARGISGAENFLEIQCDSVVVFLAPGKEMPALQPDRGLGGQPAPQAGAKDERPRRDRQLMATGVGDVEVESAYLEGDVQVTLGANAMRASKLYYDFLEDKALILDAVVRATLVERNVPLYIRASEIRQLSTKQFAANDAVLTTSEFHTPHYHVGAKRVELINRTPTTPDGRATGIRAGSFTIRDATLNISGRPIAYWPYIKGNVDTSETAIKSVRTGYSGDFGLELETEWHLFNLLGLQTPEGFDSTLNLDFYSERGPAIGIDADYERERYFGLLRSYLMTDWGEDELGEDREKVSEHDVRGRLLFRHRQYLEDDWQISLELSYLSDKTFLEEFFETEFDTGKEQETLLYLKKQHDNWALTALLQARLMDFLTQTERLPDFAFHLAGENLATASATWFSENRVGLVRYRAADQTFREFLRGGAAISSGTTPRADTRQEVGMPVDVGDIRFVPFVAGRASAWDDSPHEGGLGRGFAEAGVRGSMYLWRVYPETHSELFDIHGIRHIIKPQITAWTSDANVDKNDLFPFDETVEEINESDGVAFGVRQRWQTKRGPEDARRIVDVFTLDVEAAAFNDAEDDEVTNGFASFSRPENSISRNYVNTSAIWRMNDRTAVLSEMNYDMNDAELDVFNVSVAVERTPRLSYLIGYRFIDETESNLLGFDLNYRLTEKHTLALRELFDLDRGETLDMTIALIRKFPRWFSAVSFEVDEAEDDFGISLSVWPEGLPQAALGSRRFTGLANTTRLQND